MAAGSFYSGLVGFCVIRFVILLFSLVHSKREISSYEHKNAILNAISAAFAIVFFVGLASILLRRGFTGLLLAVDSHPILIYIGFAGVFSGIGTRVWAKD